MCRHYEILEKLDYGSFGSVYKARRLGAETNSIISSQSAQQEQFYAVKISNSAKSASGLTREADFLRKLQNIIGFPRMYYFLKNKDTSSLVMTFLGKNLEMLFREFKFQFSNKTVAMIGI